MGCTISPIKAPENGVYVVRATFTDENGAPIVPGAAAWTLTKPDGTVINSRSAVALTPAAVVLVVMVGLDLNMADGAGRVLLVEATYNSATLGNGIPLKAEFWFDVQDLVGVP